MFRFKLALGVLACVLATLAAPALAAPVDQASWPSLKKEVRLPSGIKLAYIELGNPTGAPVLLLHGYTDSSRSWSTTAPHLAAYRLIIPDQRGHGAADAPACCYNLTAYADDARQLLDLLRIERAHVVGHSLGSMVAMALAAEHPGRVRSLTLIGSTVLVPVKPGDWLYDNTTAMKSKLDPATQFAKDWHPANQPTPVDPAFADAVNADLYRIEPHVWRSVMRELSEVRVGKYAAEVRAPVLILSGGRDPLFPPPHHAALVDAFPGAEAHVFPELGHNPNWEQPEAVAKRIGAFLAKQTR